MSTQNTQQQHTPEPGSYTGRTRTDRGMVEVEYYGEPGEGLIWDQVARCNDPQDAVHIAGCWSACNGLGFEEVEALAAGGVRELVDALAGLLEWSDEHGSIAHAEVMDEDALPEDGLVAPRVKAAYTTARALLARLQGGE